MSKKPTARKQASRSSAKTEAPTHKTRNRTFAAAGALVAGLGAAWAFGLADRWRTRTRPGEHRAPDLAADAPVPGTGDRAPEAFRPDPTAPVPAEDRESLRPATGPSPTISEDRGALNGATAPGG